MNKLIKTTIGFLVILCLTLAYFTYTQIPRATYNQRNASKVLTFEVKRGELAKWQNDICKLHDHEFYSQRTFINLDTGRKYVVPEYGTKATLKKGECRISEVSQKVPDELEPGKYQILVEVFVKTNHFSTDKFQYTVGDFIIK